MPSVFIMETLVKSQYLMKVKETFSFEKLYSIDCRFQNNYIIITNLFLLGFGRLFTSTFANKFLFSTKSSDITRIYSVNKKPSNQRR
jgi:hypothetical protein